MEKKIYTLYECYFRILVPDSVIRCGMPTKAFEGTEEEIYKFIDDKFYINHNGPLSVQPEKDEFGIEEYQGGMLACYPGYKILSDGEVIDRCEGLYYNDYELTKTEIPDNIAVSLMLSDDCMDEQWGKNEDNASPLKYYAFRPIAGGCMIKENSFDTLFTSEYALNHIVNNTIDKFYFIMKDDAKVDIDYFDNLIMSIASY